MTCAICEVPRKQRAVASRIHGDTAQRWWRMKYPPNNFRAREGRKTVDLRILASAGSPMSRWKHLPAAKVDSLSQVVVARPKIARANRISYSRSYKPDLGSAVCALGREAVLGLPSAQQAARLSSSLTTSFHLMNHVESRNRASVVSNVVITA